MKCDEEKSQPTDFLEVELCRFYLGTVGVVYGGGQKGYKDDQRVRSSKPQGNREERGYVDFVGV